MELEGYQITIKKLVLYLDICPQFGTAVAV